MPEELLDLVATMKCPKCVPTMELVRDTRDLPYTCQTSVESVKGTGEVSSFFDGVSLLFVAPGFL